MSALLSTPKQPKYTTIPSTPHKSCIVERRRLPKSDYFQIVVDLVNAQNWLVLLTLVALVTVVVEAAVVAIVAPVSGRVAVTVCNAALDIQGACGVVCVECAVSLKW